MNENMCFDACEEVALLGHLHPASPPPPRFRLLPTPTLLSFIHLHLDARITIHHVVTAKPLSPGRQLKRRLPALLKIMNKTQCWDNSAILKRVGKRP